MILQQVSKEQRENYTSILRSYSDAREKLLEQTALLSAYGTVYSILSESNLYKQHKVYTVMVHGVSFVFEAPLWFENEKKEMLKKYKRMGDTLQSLSYYVAWNPMTVWRYKGEKKVYVANPPNIGELIADLFNGEPSSELVKGREEDLRALYELQDKIWHLPLRKLKKEIRKYEKELADKRKKEHRSKLPAEFEELKKAFSARDVKPLVRLTMKNRDMNEPIGYIEIIKSLDDVHQAEWMLNQKISISADEPLAVLMPQDRAYGPFPWNRRAIERISDNYHFRLNQALSIVETKVKETLLLVDEVTKNTLSIGLEADLSGFIDFLRLLRREMDSNATKEKQIVDLYFGKRV